MRGFRGSRLLNDLFSIAVSFVGGGGGGAKFRVNTQEG